MPPHFYAGHSIDFLTCDLDLDLRSVKVPVVKVI